MEIGSVEPRYTGDSLYSRAGNSPALDTCKGMSKGKLETLGAGFILFLLILHNRIDQLIIQLFA